MKLLGVHFRHMADEIQQLVAVTPLVVIPGDELHEVLIQRNTRCLVKNAGAGIADQVGGYHLVACIADNTFHVRLGGVLDLVADVRIRCRLAEPRRQVHHGYVCGGYAEGHAGHFALQGGDHATHGLGRAGSRRDDVDKDGFIGLFRGGFQMAAVGSSAALIFGYIASLIFKPKMTK